MRNVPIKTAWGIDDARSVASVDCGHRTPDRSSATSEIDTLDEEEGDGDGAQ